MAEINTIKIIDTAASITSKVINTKEIFGAGNDNKLISVQCITGGSFAGKVAVYTSLDKTNWVTAKDPNGANIEFTVADMKYLNRANQYIKFDATGVTGGSAVILIA